MHQRFLATAVLLISIAAPAFSADSAMTNFKPAVHGFQFANTPWPGEILIDVPGVGRLNFGGTSYGLCGGMSYAALDAYTHGGQPPNVTTQPPSGDKLRSYIYNRQDDSFKADNGFMIRRMIEWLPLPMHTTGVTGLHVRTDREFKRTIRPALDAGRPVPIALLKAHSNDNLRTMATKNHQALAIGYGLHPKGSKPAHWDVHIYDPNFPRTIQTLHYHEDFRYQTEYGKDVKTGDFRAFFDVPYAPKRPYWMMK